MTEPRIPWWCPTCVDEVPNKHVTYEEKHAEDCGGCGGTVVPMPEREQLRDAVIEAASKLEDTYASLWTGDGTELVGDFRERMNVAMYGVINASRALREHERKAGG